MHEREAERQGLRYVYKVIDLPDGSIEPGAARAAARRGGRARLRRAQRHPPGQAGDGAARRRARAGRDRDRRAEHRAHPRRPHDRVTTPTSPASGAPSPTGSRTPTAAASCSSEPAAPAPPWPTPWPTWASAGCSSSTPTRPGPRTLAATLPRAPDRGRAGRCGRRRRRGGTGAAAPGWSTPPRWAWPRTPGSPVPGRAAASRPLGRRHRLPPARHRPCWTWLASAGCTVLSGAGMAVHQAADAFELITGRPPTAPRCCATSTSSWREPRPRWIPLGSTTGERNR